MVARPACRVRLDPIKAEVPQSKFIDKDINSPNRIVIADISSSSAGNKVLWFRSCPTTKRIVDPSKSQENHII
jgi:hypothetical protein